MKAPIVLVTAALTVAILLVASLLIATGTRAAHRQSGATYRADVVGREVTVAAVCSRDLRCG
jgi:hypothetical protein